LATKDRAAGLCRQTEARRKTRFFPGIIAGFGRKGALQPAIFPYNRENIAPAVTETRPGGRQAKRIGEGGSPMLPLHADITPERDGSPPVSGAQAGARSAPNWVVPRKQPFVPSRDEGFFFRREAEKERRTCLIR